MKLTIDFDQWNSLTETEKLKLDEWLMKKYFIVNWQPIWSRTEYVPKRLMNIGEMIEFLDTESGYRTNIEKSYSGSWTVQHDEKIDYYENLTDALWEAVKEELKK